MGAACVSCHSLQPDEQLRIESCTGKSVKNGPGFFTVGLGRSGWTHKAIRLGPVDYIVVEDELSGDLRLERGPKLFFRGPFDNVKEKRTAITLKQNEYVKLMDSLTGRIRVERGEQTVYREPLEVFVDPKSPRQPHNGHRWMAFEVDLETAVLVRNQESGELRLVSKPQLFYCGMYEEIVEIRKLVRLLDYETVILKSNLGEFTFVHGSDTPINGTVVAKAIDGDADASALPGAVPRPNSSVSAAGVGVGVGAGAGANLGLVKGEEDEAKGSEPAGHARAFFVPPYCEIESLQWSTGDKRSDKPLHVKRIDRRPMFMNYSFLCRTSDNVELSLTVTFFWQIVDVPLMLKYTSDPPGDVCHHARSAVIQHVTKVSLEEFMKNFNTIVDRAIFGRGDGFYTQRGVKIHTVEVLHFHCKDPAIEMVLQQIIQESTNRLNRLQQQESENEVAVHRLRGDIDEERLRGDLLEIRHSHHRSEALMEGEAEADRCKAFINGMRDVVEVQDAVKLFHTLRKVEIMNHLSRGPAHLYFTPQDCSLNIETMVTEGDHAPTEQKLARGRRPVPGRSGAGGSAGAGHQEATPGSQLRSQ